MIGAFSSGRLRLALQAAILAAAGAVQAEPYPLADGREVAALETFRECGVCPEMIVLPLGRFTMGAPLAESARVDFTPRVPGVPDGVRAEGPMHEVEIDLPVAMGRNEVTRGEWIACVEDGGCSYLPPPTILAHRNRMAYYGPLDDRHPVVEVSYLDALQYATWLNRKVGAEVYRLPTEAEWEYAARGGATTLFGQGDTLTADQANFSGRGTARLEGRPRPDLADRGMPVLVDDLDAANAWGLRHMAGNVLERTMSCRSKRQLGLPTSSAYLDHARTAGPCRRIAKGGGYGSGLDYLRPANRGHGYEDYRTKIAGFRLVREMR